MLEVTAPQRWFDLTVGLTSGWWAFTDLELRPDYATLPRERWLRLLGESGFDQCAALPGGAGVAAGAAAGAGAGAGAVQGTGAAPGAGAQGCLALQSIFLARSGRGVASVASNTWIVLADQQGTADKLAATLRERHERCILVRPGAFSLDACRARRETVSSSEQPQPLSA